MAIDPGTNTGGGGTINLGGTASSMCAISPSDTVGTIGNLLERIEKLELALSQVLGANLHANTLGDISDQVGWVYGIEYMGVPGWTQTSYGTLIPPPGFTLSGNGFQLYNACTGEYENYQGVVMDENGVLQFGFTDTGNLCGAKVQAWDAAGGDTDTPYAFLRGGYSAVTNKITALSVPNGISSVVADSCQVRVEEAGIYFVTATMVVQPGAADQGADTFIRKDPGTTVAYSHGHGSGSLGISWFTLSMSGITQLAANDTVTWSMSGVGGNPVHQGKYFSMFRIKAL